MAGLDPVIWLVRHQIPGLGPGMTSRGRFHQS
jgi:hypothetical protein